MDNYFFMLNLLTTAKLKKWSFVLKLFRKTTGGGDEESKTSRKNSELNFLCSLNASLFNVFMSSRNDDDYSGIG